MIGILLGLVCLLLGGINLVYYIYIDSMVSLVALVICFICAGINFGIGIINL